MSSRSRRRPAPRRRTPERSASPGAVPLGEYLTETWLPAARTFLRPTTFSGYSQNVRTYLVPRLGTVPLDRLGPAAIDACYGWLLTERRPPLAPATVRRVHATLRRALRDAVRWGLLARNPADGASPPRAPRAEMSAWSADQLQVFLAAARRDRHYELWLCYVLTGLRRGEALGLRWSDVDLVGSRLTIRRALLAVDHRLVLGEPKTSRGRRTIALDAHLTAALADLRRRRQARGRGADGEWVFCEADGSPLHPEHVSRFFQRVVGWTDLPRIRLHDIRHSHATLALAAGVDTRIVSARLGHGQVATTADIYQHALPGLDREAADRMAALIIPHPEHAPVDARPSGPGSAT